MASSIATQPTKDCGCGCGGDTDAHRCGELVCLTQPRFFCGQLLNDTDLTALLNWTKDRLRLARYRDGWGVVHGLKVEIGTDLVPGVVVSPGYAVTCCGDDVILCEKTPVPLDDTCGWGTTPCEPVDRYSQLPQKVSKGAVGDEQPGDAVCDLLLTIRYREQETMPQTVLRGGSCHQVGTCAPSRTEEGFELVWERYPEDRLKSRVRDWCEAYRACADVLLGFAGRVKETADLKPDPTLAHAWFDHSYLLSHPLRHLRALNAPPRTGDSINEDARLIPLFRPIAPSLAHIDFARILTMAVQDRRNQFLSTYRDCLPPCVGEGGVPLARVHVTREATGEQRISWVDPFPPYRRSLSRDDCWPACPGAWNLGRFIWGRLPDVCTSLRELGFKVHHLPLAGSHLTDLYNVLAPPPIVGCPSEDGECCPSEECVCVTNDIDLYLYWVTAPDKSKRVVAIRQDQLPGTASTTTSTTTELTEPTVNESDRIKEVPDRDLNQPPDPVVAQRKPSIRKTPVAPK